jgi:hypothetical protein
VRSRGSASSNDAPSPLHDARDGAFRNCATDKDKVDTENRRDSAAEARARYILTSLVSTFRACRERF